MGLSVAPPTGRDLFAAVAPFLERCHRERRAELALIDTQLRALRGKESRLERLLAHRELQEIRAGAIGDRKYLRYRAKKLELVRGDLERVREAIRGLEARR